MDGEWHDQLCAVISNLIKQARMACLDVSKGFVHERIHSMILLF